MDDLPAELRAFLEGQPFLELTDSNKVKCTLNGHEFPCNLAQLQNFTSGKKFKKLCSNAEFNYSQYEPHLVASTKEPSRLFCKLTLRHINRIPQHVLRHVSGKRYKKALAQYEECAKLGVVFVPASLKRRRRPRDANGEPSTSGGQRRMKPGSDFWAPCSSDGEDGDSEDSMSDLYPSSLFTLKKAEAQEEMEEGDDFQTDDMEFSEMGDKQEPQKRKKAQSVGFNKKFKKNRKRKGFKTVG
ncbi:hypothetical protein P4O66_016166, partial [Electrophorus voltai]